MFGYTYTTTDRKKYMVVYGNSTGDCKTIILEDINQRLDE